MASPGLTWWFLVVVGVLERSDQMSCGTGTGTGTGKAPVNAGAPACWAPKRRRAGLPRVSGSGTGTGTEKAPVNAGAPACWRPKDCSCESPAAGWSMLGLD